LELKICVETFVSEPIAVDVDYFGSARADSKELSTLEVEGSFGFRVIRIEVSVPVILVLELV